MGIRIKSFPLGPLQTNAYVLLADPVLGEGESGEAKKERAIVIDPGMNPGPLLKAIAGAEVEAILLTHAHFDHMAGLDEVRKAAGHPPVYMHSIEADWLSDPRKNGSARWPDVTPAIVAAPADYDLDAGQKLKLIGETFQVMHTPGHSPGSVSFLCGQHLFSGDVLFRMSVGRTDLPGGKERDLYNSIVSQLFPLPEDTIVYPGHGARTTIGFEKANNPYIR